MAKTRLRQSDILSRYWTVILSTLLLGAAGCAAGYSVKPVSLTPTGATFEYTYSVSREYPATVRAAEAHCQGYQKHARPVGQPVILGRDRAVATFECVT